MNKHQHYISMHGGKFYKLHKKTTTAAATSKLSDPSEKYPTIYENSIPSFIESVHEN